jgi:hypothetical protein
VARLHGHERNPEGRCLLPARIGRITGIEYITVVCLILKLRQALTDAFWINVPRLLITDSTQLYPSDRTISGMSGQARKVADLVEQLRS